MLRCRDVTELTTEFLERRLPPARRMAFRLHVAMCRHCRAYLAQIRTVIRSLRSLPASVVAPEVHERLMTGFRKWREASGPSPA